MIHAQQRREAATNEPLAPEPPTEPDVTVPAVPRQVPGRHERRPDAYDLYAEIFAIRAESHPA